MRYMEALGATELAEMFNTIVKLYEFEEQRQMPGAGYIVPAAASRRDPERCEFLPMRR
jgi:hypothetical protein